MATPSEEAMSMKSWTDLLDACVGHLQLAHCFDDEMLDKTRRDSPDGAQCAVLRLRPVRDEIDISVVFASRSLQQALLMDASKVFSYSGLGFLGAGPSDLDEACNEEAWTELAGSYTDFLQVRPLPSPNSVLLLSSNSDGDRFWTLLDAIPVVMDGALYVVHVATVLKTFVPLALMKNTKGIHGSCRVFLSKLRKELRRLRSKSSESVCELALQACDKLTDGMTDCEVGHHFVPRTGLQEGAQLQSNQLEQVAEELRCMLTNCFEVSGLNDVAHFFMDPKDLDSPIVYASQCLGEFFGFSSAWACGRNWRFLQLHDWNDNKAYNAEELARIEKYCKDPQEEFLVILLRLQNEQGPFWSIAIVKHVRVAQRAMIFFGFRPCLPSQRDVLDKLLSSDQASSQTTSEGLQSIRSLLRKKETDISKDSTLTMVLGSLFLDWLRDEGTTRIGGDYWEGGHYVPRVGESAVLEFAGIWPSLIDVVKESIKSLFSLQGQAIGSLREQVDSNIVAAVSDPTSVDCPLVFVSKSFEKMTGYSSEYCLGRNCRFLQPNIPEFNKKINGDELMRMREFCTKVHPKGHFITNLLLNEKRNGDRFWNLLYMTHVEVDNRSYILAVQSILNLPMPSKIVTQDATMALLDHSEMDFYLFLEHLVPKIEVLRGQLRQGQSSNLAKVAKKMSDNIRKWMKNSSDEYEGDHLVPRGGMKQVNIFQSDVTWRRTFDSIKNKLWSLFCIKTDFEASGDIDTKRVACALADPAGVDCPLVFVSREFEDLTGYVRDWALGRNCRFLQPNSRQVNKLLNSEEGGRMRPFCTEWQPEGTQIVVILVNESHDSFPFLNLLIMEHIKVDGRPYIFAIQTNLENELHRLVEVLGMCETACAELHRLRLLMQDSFDVQKNGKTIREVAAEKVELFVKDLPRKLLPLEVKDTGEALVSLQLSPHVDLLQEIASAICAGIRHFTLTIVQNNLPSGDGSMALMEGRLRAMQVGKALHSLKSRYLHYLRSALRFTVVLPSLHVDCFTEIRHAIVSSGYIMDGFMLDVRGMKPANLASSWKKMAEAKRREEVNWIGLWGCGRLAEDQIIKCSQVEKVSTCAIDMATYLDLVGEHPQLQHIMQRGVAITIFNVFGPKQALLTNAAVKEEANDLKVSPGMLALKWVEHQGARSVMPHMPEDSKEANKESDASKEEGKDDDAASLGESSSDESDASSEEVRIEPVHRKFVQDYRRAPDAATCAAAMSSALAKMGRLSDRHLSDQNDAHRGRVARRNSASDVPDASQSSPNSARVLLQRRGSTTVEMERRQPRGKAQTAAGNLTVTDSIDERKARNATAGPLARLWREKARAAKAARGKQVPAKDADLTVTDSMDEWEDRKSSRARNSSVGPLTRRKSVNYVEVDEDVLRKPPPEINRSKSVGLEDSLTMQSPKWSKNRPNTLDDDGSPWRRSSEHPATSLSARRLAPLLDRTKSTPESSLDNPAWQSSKNFSLSALRRQASKGGRGVSDRLQECEQQLQAALKENDSLRAQLGQQKMLDATVIGMEPELPEMVRQIIIRLLNEDMTILKVAEIIGVDQAAVEKIAAKAAETKTEVEGIRGTMQECLVNGVKDGSLESLLAMTAVKEQAIAA